MVLNHTKSNKHKDSKQQLTINKARERDLAKALEKHDAETHRKGETLPDDQKEKNNYSNNRGLFWELENRIIGRKKSNVHTPTEECHEDTL